jgi:hypothetical protein
MPHNCKRCDYVCNSTGTLATHIKEKHTHRGCILTQCLLCEKLFYQEPKHGPKKCQECRELQIALKTNDLKYGNYVYKNNKRYFIDKGFVKEVCIVYNCLGEANCNEHSELKTCSSCKKIHSDESILCSVCYLQSTEAKNITRKKVVELKKTLGGKCVSCNDIRLYCLEFDHVEPSKKTKQITRMNPKDWKTEIYNIQLLCGNCHRIKSVQELRERHKNAKNKNKNRTKFLKTDSIKISIGKCQICKWTSINQADICSVLEFDHINKDKVKQVSNLGGKKARIEETMKCRLICRCCHQITTCLQRGGIMLQLQMTQEEYTQLYDKYMNRDQMLIMNHEVMKTVQKLYPEFFDNSFYSMEKIGFSEYAMNYTGEIKSIFSGQIKTPVNNYKIQLFDDKKSDKTYFYILELYAKMFIPNPNNYKFVRLKYKTNGLALDNVEWTDTLMVEKYAQYSLDNKRLNDFYSIEEASKSVNVDSSNISKAITHKRTCRGYLWRKEMIEEINPQIPESILYKYFQI